MSIGLGKLGVWRLASELTRELVAEVESLGYGAIWVGGNPPGDLGVVEDLLSTTHRIAVATGIVNVWKDDAATVGPAFHRVSAAYPGRFLLGLGIGHSEVTPHYQHPYAKLVSYLDELDQMGVPAEGRVLAALGPKMLALAARRAAGAHPYLVTPEHTRQARQILGEGPLLAPEQKVVLETDPGLARAIARPPVQNPYLGLTNYRRNLRKLGWTDADLADGGSDALIDALVVHGNARALARGVTAHLDAGADHVAVQALDPDPMPALRALAGELQLASGYTSAVPMSPLRVTRPGQLSGAQRAGPGRPGGQDHVARLRRAVPDRAPHVLRQGQAEHGPRTRGPSATGRRSSCTSSARARTATPGSRSTACRR